MSNDTVVRAPWAALVVVSAILVVVLVAAWFGPPMMNAYRSYAALSQAEKDLADAILHHDFERAHRHGSREFQDAVSVDSLRAFNLKFERRLGALRNVGMLDVGGSLSNLRDRERRLVGTTTTMETRTYEKGRLVLMDQWTLEDSEWRLILIDVPR